MKANNAAELKAELKRHFRDVLSIEIDPRAWPGEAALPAFLREAYAFLSTRILGEPCLMMVDRGVHPNTPAAIRKHLFEVGSRWQGTMVYVAAGVDSARRKQLIDQKVPFVVPGNQVYLPMLGMDLREHFRSVRGAVESLSPATQAVFLHLLQGGKDRASSPQEMAAPLGYSTMTLSRAFDELERAGIGKHSVHGRRRLMELVGPRRDLWEKALPQLRNPVLRRAPLTAFRDQVEAPAAGLTALAAYTNLSEPNVPVIAVATARWQTLRNSSTHTPAGADTHLTEVEVWTYPPNAVAPGPVVDRLSLYLSLRGTPDERVEAALSELLEGVKW